MKTHAWLRINSNGSMRISKSEPGLDWDEVKMFLNIDIPDSVFKRPQLKANIKIDGELNYEFDYQTEKNIEEVLKTLPNVHLVSVDVHKEETKQTERK